jgi:hypothetical protein
LQLSLKNQIRPRRLLARVNLEKSQVKKLERSQVKASEKHSYLHQYT